MLKFEEYWVFYWDLLLDFSINNHIIVCFKIRKNFFPSLLPNDNWEFSEQMLCLLKTRYFIGLSDYLKNIFQLLFLFLADKVEQ